MDDFNDYDGYLCLFQKRTDQWPWLYPLAYLLLLSIQQAVEKDATVIYNQIDFGLLTK